MPIIYQLLRSLSDEEKKRVSELPIQDRERDVLQTMLQLNNRIFPSNTVCKKLGIQTSHLDKINSILFKKSIEELAGKDVYKQVAYLDQKSNLWNVSKRVLNFHEQKVISVSASGEEKFRFYSFYFQWLNTVPGTLRSEEELDRIAKEILHNCPEEKYRETVLWIDIISLRKDINASIAQATFNKKEVQERIGEKIRFLIAEAGAVGTPENQFKVRLAGVIFYNVIKNFSQARILITEINRLLIDHPEAFTPTDLLVAQWHYAQVLFFSSQFDESFKIYKEIVEQININDLARWYVLVAEYFQVSLVTNHYDICTQLCDVYFSKFFRDQNANFYLSSLIQCCKLLVHTGEWEDAKIKLDMLHKHTSKTASLQFQFALRELTVAWYYLTGKFEKAMVIAEKNLKYMRSKKIHHLIPEYTFHSRLVKSIIRNKTRKTPLTEEDNIMFSIMQQGSMAQYGMLLKRLIEEKVSD